MNETYRKIAVLIEIENSIKYLRNGLSELQKITPTNDFYDPTLLFLSSGLERLFKTMLCLNFKEVNGRLPSRNEIWNHRQGHDIEFLKSETLTFFNNGKIIRRNPRTLPYPVFLQGRKRRFDHAENSLVLPVATFSSWSKSMTMPSPLT